MSDERRRSLERVARADPTDAAAGQALARALEQSGARRQAHLEHARLARQGQAEARAIVDGWAPRPHAAAAVTRRPALGEPVRQREVQVPGLVLAPCLLASDQRIVLPMRTGLVALDPDTLVERWSAPEQGWPAALRGDDVVHSGGPGLVLRDGADGAPLAELPLVGRVIELFTWGDRGLVVHDAPGVRRVSALDLGPAPGRVLWTRDWPAGALDLIRPARRRLVVAGPQRVEVLELESGRTIAGQGLIAAGSRSTRWERARLADARGALVEEVTPDLTGGPAACRVSERDLTRLEPRWHIELPASQLEVALGLDVAVLRSVGPDGPDGPDGAPSTTVVDRASGTSRRVDAPPGGLGGLAWSDGAAYRVECDGEPGPSNTPGAALAVHDPRTLERRARHPLQVGPDLVEAQVLPLAGAVVVLLAHRDRTILVRLESHA